MIAYQADHHFHIGKQHLTSGMPCQDYAISGLNRGSVVAVVSDGCSTGGHTDVGSRALVFTAVSAIKNHWATKHSVDPQTPKEIGVSHKIGLAQARASLGLQVKDMFATCQYVYMGPEGGYTHLQGDGVVAVKYRDGSMLMSRFDWDKNTPFYLAYSHNDYEDFIRCHGGDVSVHKLTEEYWKYFPEKNIFSDLGTKTFSISEGIQGITRFFSKEELEDADYGIEYIAIFSDGVTQIGKVGDSIDWKDAVVELMRFKTPKGEFATRRLNSYIRNLQKRGFNPTDDIAYAVVQVGIVPESEVIQNADQENDKD